MQHRIALSRSMSLDAAGFLRQFISVSINMQIKSLSPCHVSRTAAATAARNELIKLAAIIIHASSRLNCAFLENFAFSLYLCVYRSFSVLAPIREFAQKIPPPMDLMNKSGDFCVRVCAWGFIREKRKRDFYAKIGRRCERMSSSLFVLSFPREREMIKHFINKNNGSARVEEDQQQ
jgi:hypothetical protein